MNVANLWFKMEIDSGNEAVVSDPAGTIRDCMKQVSDKMPTILIGERIKLRDANGNSIGRAWATLDHEDGRGPA